MTKINLRTIVGAGLGGYALLSFASMLLPGIEPNLRLVPIASSGAVSVAAIARNHLSKSLIRLIGGFILPLLAIALVQIAYFPDSFDDFGRSTQEYLIASLLLCGCFYFSGIILFRESIITSSRYAMSVSFSMLVAVALVAYPGVVIDYSSTARGGELSGSHLYLSESSLLISAIAISKASRSQRPIVFAMCVIALLMIGGRAALVALIFSYLAFEFLNGGLTAWIKIAMSVIALSFIYLVISQGVYSDSGVSRIVLEDGLDRDGSYLTRLKQFEEAFYLLGEQIWVGNPHIVISRLGSVGEFAHNIMSAWQWFGVLGLLIFTVQIYFLCKWVLFKNGAERVRGSDSSDLFWFIVVASSCLLALGARNVFFPLLWLSIGALHSRRTWRG